MMGVLGIREFPGIVWISSGAIFSWGGSKMCGNCVKNGKFPAACWVFLDICEMPAGTWWGSRISSAILNFQRLQIIRRLTRKCMGIGRLSAHFLSYFGYPALRLFAQESGKLLKIQKMMGIREFTALFRSPIGAIFARWSSKMGGNWVKNGQFPVVFWVFGGLRNVPKCCRGFENF